MFKGTVEKCLEEPDLQETKLFEAIQSSNWNDVRLKPPPSLQSSIGWRVEFRSMEVQLTPSLTFLFSYSLLILSRLLAYMRTSLSFYLPLSLVEENFRRANLRGAAVNQKFFFRVNVSESGPAKVRELYIREIFEGTVRLTYSGRICGHEQVVGSVLAKGSRSTGQRILQNGCHVHPAS